MLAVALAVVPCEFWTWNVRGYVPAAVTVARNPPAGSGTRETPPKDGALVPVVTMLYGYPAASLNPVSSPGAAILM
jgi:hypothetical protein